MCAVTSWSVGPTTTSSRSAAGSRSTAAQTEPLERFYRERGLLREVDAQAREDDVTERTLAVLADIEE